MNESFSETPPSLSEPESTVKSQSMQNQPTQNQFMQNQSMQRNYNRNYFQQLNQSSPECQRSADCAKPADCAQPVDCSRPMDCSKSMDCSRPMDCSKPSDCERPQVKDCQPPHSHTNCDCIAYQAALPYPLIRPECKNPRYASAILDNLGGQNSEMSAIGFYFYNRITACEWKEVVDTFYHIGMVEMHHMELFSKLAMELGENPRLWSRKGRGGQYVCWSPSYIPYGPFPVGSAIKNVLSQAIKGEQEAVSKYMQQTTWITNTNVCDNLLRIAADEQVHIDILTRLYHKF